jgi:hypothetical protein
MTADRAPVLLAATLLVVLALRSDRALAGPNQRRASSSHPSSSAQGRSALRVTLVSTVVAEPARYSVCQIRNDETNSTKIFAVGDDLMGWRIDRIAKDQVWLGRGAKLEYIERFRSGQTPASTGASPDPNDPAYVSPHGQ